MEILISEVQHFGNFELSAMACVYIFSLSEGEDSVTIMELRKQLRDKDMKLTDIRLEALSSAHQLEQLREAMNKMKVRIFGRPTVSDETRITNNPLLTLKAQIATKVVCFSSLLKC